METEPLSSFYSEYFGASVGNSQLIFATNIEGGVYVSHKLRLPDFHQMAAQARALGMQLKASEKVFLSEAAWMFLYTLNNEDGRTILRRYDRDCCTYQIVETIYEVLENWWKIVELDKPTK
jgi:hypothetical protein